MAFLTFDDEHHRFAFLDLAVVDPEGADPDTKGWVGVDHLAWTQASLDDLFAHYPPPPPSLIASPRVSNPPPTGVCIMD